MTPKVLSREFEAARLRSADGYRRDATLAWNIARVYFDARSNRRLMSLSKLLSEIRDSSMSERQSATQLKAVIGEMAHMYGGMTVRKRKGLKARRRSGE